MMMLEPVIDTAKRELTERFWQRFPSTGIVVPSERDLISGIKPSKNDDGIEYSDSKVLRIKVGYVLGSDGSLVSTDVGVERDPDSIILKIRRGYALDTDGVLRHLGDISESDLELVEPKKVPEPESRYISSTRLLFDEMTPMSFDLTRDVTEYFKSKHTPLYAPL